MGTIPKHSCNKKGSYENSPLFLLSVATKTTIVHCLFSNITSTDCRAILRIKYLIHSCTLVQTPASLFPKQFELQSPWVRQKNKAEPTLLPRSLCTDDDRLSVKFCPFWWYVPAFVVQTHYRWTPEDSRSRATQVCLLVRINACFCNIAVVSKSKVSITIVLSLLQTTIFECCITVVYTYILNNTRYMTVRASMHSVSWLVYVNGGQFASQVKGKRSRCRR